MLVYLLRQDCSAVAIFLELDFCLFEWPCPRNLSRALAAGMSRLLKRREVVKLGNPVAMCIGLRFGCMLPKSKYAETIKFSDSISS